MLYTILPSVLYVINAGPPLEATHFIAAACCALVVMIYQVFRRPFKWEKMKMHVSLGLLQTRLGAHLLCGRRSRDNDAAPCLHLLLCDFLFEEKTADIWFVQPFN